MNQDSKKSTEKSISWSNFVIIGLSIIVVWFLSILAVDFLFGNASNENSAWFGDSFGAINSLFSGLAFAGIIFTIFLQKKELAETRLELNRSANAQEKSEEAFSKQVYLMSKTAELNALNSRMQFFEIMIGVHINNSGVRSNYIKKLGDVNREMEKVLLEINKVTQE